MSTKIIFKSKNQKKGKNLFTKIITASLLVIFAVSLIPAYPIRKVSAAGLSGTLGTVDWSVDEKEEAGGRHTP